MISTTLAYFPSPAQGVWHLGPIPIRAYALFIIAGIIAALVLGDRRWAARGGERGVIYDIALWAVPFGLIGGRLYHVMTDWKTYFGPEGAGPIAALKIWDGGLGIWGAVALGGVGAWIGCKSRGIPLPAFGDAIAPGIVLAQAIGRLGNYFNQELYGRETTVPWGMEIFYRRDPSGILDVHSLTGVSTGQVAGVVHPTFLYELLWNLLIFVILIYVDRRFKIGHGRLFALYVAGYCVGRFWVELMRDDVATHIAGIRINSFTSTFVFIGAIVYFILAPKGREDPASLAGKQDSDESLADALAKDLVAVAATTGVVAAATVAGGEDEAPVPSDDAEPDPEPEVATEETPEAEASTNVDEVTDEAYEAAEPAAAEAAADAVAAAEPEAEGAVAEVAEPAAEAEPAATDSEAEASTNDDAVAEGKAAESEPAAEAEVAAVVERAEAEAERASTDSEPEASTNDDAVAEGEAAESEPAAEAEVAAVVEPAEAEAEPAATDSEPEASTNDDAPDADASESPDPDPEPVADEAAEPETAEPETAEPATAEAETPDAEPEAAATDADDVEASPEDEAVVEAEAVSPDAPEVEVESAAVAEDEDLIDEDHDPVDDDDLEADGEDAPALSAAVSEQEEELEATDESDEADAAESDDADSDDADADDEAEATAETTEPESAPATDEAEAEPLPETQPAIPVTAATVAVPTTSGPDSTARRSVWSRLRRR